MGNILSRFKSFESTKETLARIHMEIEEIEDYKWITLRNQNHIIGLYIFGLSIVCAFIVIMFYFYYMQRLKNKGFIAFILYITIFPILTYFLKNFLKNYYQHKLAVQEDRLHELKRNKRKILNEIMEKETYKVAKELIEKYDPTMLKEKNFSSEPYSSDHSMRLNQSMENSILRQRTNTNLNPFNQLPTNVLSSNSKMVPSIMSPKQPRSLILSNSHLKTPYLLNQQANRTKIQPALLDQRMGTPIAQLKPNLVRPLCAQDRSIVEKFVDYLVGDGPNNRYGLICKFCYSHNGMALKEEFEYLNFRCCYCNNLNLARKQKPIAPSLISHESNTKNNLDDESLSESLKKFEIEGDESIESSEKIEEIENKLIETKLDENDTKSITENDKMQIDVEINRLEVKNTQEILDKDDELSKEPFNQQFDNLKLNE